MVVFVGEQFSNWHTEQLGFFRDLSEAPWEVMDDPILICLSIVDSARETLKWSVLFELNNISFEERILKLKNVLNHSDRFLLIAKKISMINLLISLKEQFTGINVFVLIFVLI